MNERAHGAPATAVGEPGTLYCGFSPESASHMTDTLLASLDATVRASATPQGDESSKKEINILAISGGGLNGAYAAGFLAGWRKNPQTPRPESFDVVTGVSTGALVSTFAFLGRPVDDKLLKEAYTTIYPRDIMRKPRLIRALFSNSLAGNEPLIEQLEKYLTDEILDEVAREHQKGRRLYVAATNLDLGVIWPFDLGCIASQPDRAEARRAYIQAVLSSASIPIFYPPVIENGFMLCDGGISAMAYYRQHLEPILDVVQTATSNLSDSVTPKTNLYLLNNWITQTPPELTRNRFGSIAYQALLVSLATDTRSTTELISVRCEADDGCEFYYNTIPAEAVVYSMTKFTPKELLRTYDIGYNIAIGPDTWSR